MSYQQQLLNGNVKNNHIDIDEEEEFIKNAFKIDNNSSSIRKSMQFLRSRF